jgi:hypothetical protein
VDWTNRAQDRGQWWAFVNTVMNLYCRVMHPVARTIKVVRNKTATRNNCIR